MTNVSDTGSVRRPVSVSEPGEGSGEAIVASFTSYAAAHAALDRLARDGTAMGSPRIFARDLAFVERMVGPVPFGRSVADGAWSGALVGGLIGFFFGIFDWFAPVRSALVLAWWGVILGAVVGAGIAAVVHWGGGRRRDYTHVASLEAGRYDLVANARQADELRRQLGSVQVAERR